MPEPDRNPRPADDDSFFNGQNWFSKRMVDLISAITPRCSEVTRILSHGMDHPLPLTTRLTLRLHFLMCTFCQRYGEHLHYMRTASRAFPEHLDEASVVQLPSETKERLKQILRDPTQAG